MADLVARYRAQLPAALQATERDADPDLEQALAAALREARQQYPEVSLADGDFVEHVARKRQETETARGHLEATCVPDLYLALGCQLGEEAALQILRQRVIPQVAPALRRFNPSETFADEVQQRGTVDHTPVYVREVVKRALELSATAIVLVHNHPSGDPEPSPEDVEITRRLCAVGELVGIRVVDHVVVAEGGYVSFLERGMIP